MSRDEFVRALSRVVVTMVVVVATLTVAGPAVATAPPGYNDLTDVWPTAVAPASCREGDRVETGIQGEVPLADRKSGRSTQGYNCNIDLIGQYQGQGAGIVSATYKNCSYTGSTFPASFVGPNPGVQVIDASDPRNPRLSAVLTEPAMVGGTWESLKVNQKRGLLVGTGVAMLQGTGYISVYDISQDCAHPRLLNTGAGSQLNMPMPITTHEGDFSPDGNTYWVSGLAPGYVSAVDLTDPRNPMIVWSGITGIEAHGMGFSPDGNTLYLANLFGLTVIDVTAVQNRKPRTIVAQLMPHLGEKYWADGQVTQHNIYATYDGHPFIFSVDEAGSGGVKLFDASNSANLTQRNAIKLAINLPENANRWAQSTAGNGLFGYDAHYCAIDRPVDPTAMACGWIQSGIRVFDIKDPDHFREIAYFNPPAQRGKADQLTNSSHALFGAVDLPAILGTLAVARAVLQGEARADGIISDQNRLAGGDLSADWCLSPPEFHGNQLWVTCMDNGFMTLQLDPAIYPPR